MLMTVLTTVLAYIGVGIILSAAMLLLTVSVLAIGFIIVDAITGGYMDK